MFDENTHKALSSRFNDPFIFILYVCIFTIHKGYPWRLEEKAEYPGAAQCEVLGPKFRSSRGALHTFHSPAISLAFLPHISGHNVT